MVQISVNLGKLFGNSYVVNDSMAEFHDVTGFLVPSTMPVVRF